MSLIQTPTLEQVQLQLKAELSAKLQRNFRQLLNDAQAGFNAIWNNPSLTPQQALDAFGTDASVLFLVNQEIAEILNAIVPGSWTLEIPYNYTINQDGTVTVGAKV